MSWTLLLKTEFLHNDLGAWLRAVVTFLLVLTVLPLLTGFIRARRRRLTLHGPPKVFLAIDLAALLVARTSYLFIWGIALWLGSRHLTFPPRLERWLTVFLVALFWMQAALWAMTAVRYGIDVRRRAGVGPATLLEGSMEVIMFAAGVIVWTVAALLALDDLGVEIRPLLAGLGIGGIALALAVQTVLSDLLASLSIALDKPFGLGDFLVVDAFQGSVEHIGVKSTRLRSLDGEQIVMSNSDILKSRVRNYGRMRERRALFTLGVDYDTPIAQLAAIPRAVREIIEATPDTRFDRCHLMKCGTGALQFEVVFYVTRPEYNLYADAQQRINLRILERFHTMEVKFAAELPTTVRVTGMPLPREDPGGQQQLI
jgi:small-conductance mechanosensitive channel